MGKVNQPRERIRGREIGESEREKGERKRWDEVEGRMKSS